MPDTKCKNEKVFRTRINPEKKNGNNESKEDRMKMKEEEKEEEKKEKERVKERIISAVKLRRKIHRANPKPRDIALN